MATLDRRSDPVAVYGVPDCEPFEVYALRYATRPGLRSENFYERVKQDGPMPLSYYTWLARSPRRTVLIDTGLSREYAERAGRTFLRCPIESWKLLGVDPASIQDVLITHMHSDHIGNVGKLPNATFHLQDAEMAYATGRYAGHSCCATPFDQDAVVQLLRLNFAGRVRFHNGSEAVDPGISLHLVGGHTAGLQIVRIWTRSGWLVLASDASHFFENIETGRPFHLSYDVGQMLDAFTTLRTLASAPRLIVPGHDPSVMERYPSVGGELKDIAVRLD